MDFAREFIHKGVFFTKTDPFTSLWFVGLRAALPAAACRSASRRVPLCQPPRAACAACCHVPCLYMLPNGRRPHSAEHANIIPESAAPSIASSARNAARKSRIPLRRLIGGGSKARFRHSFAHILYRLLSLFLFRCLLFANRLPFLFRDSLVKNWGKLLHL